MRIPPSAPAARRRQTMPFGSLILCILLVLMQMVSWPILFVAGVEHRQNPTVTTLLHVPMILWMLLPAGSIYGLYLALRREAGEFGRVPRVLGVIANALYLLIGIFLWLILLLGVRV
jgi:hypothetical protein